MKKKIILILCISIFTAMLVACSDSKDTERNTTLNISGIEREADNKKLAQLKGIVTAINTALSKESAFNAATKAYSGLSYSLADALQNNDDFANQLRAELNDSYEKVYFYITKDGLACAYYEGMPKADDISNKLFMINVEYSEILDKYLIEGNQKAIDELK